MHCHAWPTGSTRHTSVTHWERKPAPKCFTFLATSKVVELKNRVFKAKNASFESNIP